MANNTFWCLTTFFNPAGYKSRLQNYLIFAENLMRQNVNLLTIELAFGNDAFYLRPSANVIHMRAKSVLWHKERMLNYAIANLPEECKYIAWVDGDIIFDDDNWAEHLIGKLQTNDIVQPFQEVVSLAPKETSPTGKHLETERAVVWQYKTNDNWLEKRKGWKLPYATIGYGWASKRNAFDTCDGMYDRHVLGSSDNLVIDSCLNSFGLHHYWNNISPALKTDMQEWVGKFGIGKNVDYVPGKIYHLFHGAKKYRGYISRETIIKSNNFDPKTDITLDNDVYEWCSDKHELHLQCRNYFYMRREDDDTIPVDSHVRL